MAEPFDPPSRLIADGALEPRRRSFEFARTVCSGFLRAELDIGTLTRARDGISWSDLRQFVYVHNLEPICHRVVGCHPTGQRLVPADLLDRWEEAYYKNVIFNAGILEFVGRIAGAATEQQAELAVWKGPIVTADVYRDIGLRIAVDVDLMCRKEHVAAVCSVLFDLGCRPADVVGPYSLAFRAPAQAIEVDLHFDLYDTVTDRRRFLAAAFRELEWLQVDETRLPAFGPEAHLTLMFAHIAKHEFRVDLRQCLDFAGALVMSVRPPRWDVLDGFLSKTGLGSEFRVLAASVAELFDLPRDKIPLLSASRPAEVERRKSLVYAHMLTIETVPPKGVAPGARLHDSYLGKARYVLRRLFPPLACLAALHDSRHPVVGLLYLPGHLRRALVRPLRSWLRGVAFVT